MKKPNNTLLIVCVALLIVSIDLPASTQTIVVKVPVVLKDIHPDIASVSVQVILLTATKRNLAFGREDVPIVNGRMNKTINVEVKANVNAQDQAVYYRAKLYLFPKSGSGFTPSYDHQHKPARAKKGTPLVVQVEGKIPGR